MPGSSHHILQLADVPAGLDVLKGKNQAEMKLGAQSHRIPVILLLDIPADQTEAFEPYLKSFLALLYAFEFAHPSQCRISLSVLTTAGDGCVLLPPRLLHGRSLAECGLRFFKNCSWIEQEQLEAVLFPLPRETGRGMAGINAALKSYFEPNRIAPAAYAVGNGDAPCLTILVTGQQDENRIATWRSFTELPAFQNHCHALCIWRPLEAAADGLGESGDGAFLATGGVENGLGDALGRWLSVLAADVDALFQDITKRPNSINIFPDAILPCLRGQLPTVKFSEQESTPCLLLPLAPVLLDGTREIADLTLTLNLCLPLDEGLDVSNVHVDFVVPENCFDILERDLTAGATAPAEGFRTYTLTMRCAPSGGDWAKIATGLNFRANLACTSTRRAYETILFGVVWLPPTTLPFAGKPKLPSQVTPPPAATQTTAVQTTTVPPTTPSPQPSTKPALWRVTLPWLCVILMLPVLAWALLTRNTLKNTLEESRAAEEALDHKAQTLEELLKKYTGEKTTYAELEGLFVDYLKQEFTEYKKAEETRLEQRLAVAKEETDRVYTALKKEFDDYKTAHPASAGGSEKFEKLQKELVRAQDDYKELKADFEAYQRSNPPDASKQLAQAQRDLAAKRTELDDARNELKSANTKLADAQRDYRTLQDQFDAYKKDNSKNSSAATQELAKVRQDLITTREERDKASAQQASLQKELESAKAALATLQNEFDTYKRKNPDGGSAQQASLRQELERAKAALATLQNDFDTYKRKNPDGGSTQEASLRQELERANAALAEAQNANKALQDELNKYKRKNPEGGVSANTLQAIQADAGLTAFDMAQQCYNRMTNASTDAERQAIRMAYELCAIARNKADSRFQTQFNNLFNQLSQ